MPDRHFQLHDHIGLEPAYITHPKTGEPVENPVAGEPGVANTWGFTLATEIPVEIKEGHIEAVRNSTRIELEPIPDTRIYRVDNPIVATAVAQTGDELVHEIDPPKKTDLEKIQKHFQGHREAHDKALGNTTHTPKEN